MVVDAPLTFGRQSEIEGGGGSPKTSPEMAFSSYGARFETGFEPGERGERRDPHRGVMGDIGVPERLCADEGRTAVRTLVGEEVAASAACSWASRWVPGVPVCEWEREG
jgi:hypothetical protein